MEQNSPDTIIIPTPDVSTNVHTPNFFTEISWSNGFQKWNLIRLATPMDNNCLFHAISNSFFAPYHTETLNGKSMSKYHMVMCLRKELATKLAAKISTDVNAPTYYETLNGGNTAIFSKDVPEFTLQHMQSQLRSQVPIGYGYLEFIGNALNKDIYILDGIRQDIYKTDELPYTIHGDRNSIVLYYTSGHYELIGIRNNDESFNTHFAPDHSFIQFLKSRVNQPL